MRELARETLATVLISGGAIGVDRTAEETARACGLRVISLRPRKVKYRYGVDRHVWDRKGDLTVYRDDFDEYFDFRAAAFDRNRLIVAYAERIYAFWNERSTGTAHALAEARTRGKPVCIYNADGKLL